MKPKLSIIITCYNLGAYIEEAVTSIINYPEKDNLEIIIVNDGSSDILTLDVLKKIEKQFPKIYILHQENQGLGSARNNAIAMARGAYIIPLDADNKLRHKFVTMAIRILEAHPDVDVVHGNAEFFGKKTGIWKAKPFDISEMVLNNYIDACACFRKVVWQDIGGFDSQMPVMGFEDWDFWLRLAVKGHRFEYVDEVFFDYRVREGSMLSGAWKKRQILLDYIFDKKELKHLGVLRKVLIENQNLKYEPSFDTLISMLWRKIKKRML